MQCGRLIWIWRKNNGMTTLLPFYLLFSLHIAAYSQRMVMVHSLWLYLHPFVCASSAFLSVCGRTEYCANQQSFLFFAWLESLPYIQWVTKPPQRIYRVHIVWLVRCVSLLWMEKRLRENGQQEKTFFCKFSNRTGNACPCGYFYERPFEESTTIDITYNKYNILHLHMLLYNCVYFNDETRLDHCGRKRNRI